MNVYYVILAACPIVLLGAVAFLVMIAAAIRKADRGEIVKGHWEMPGGGHGLCPLVAIGSAR